MKKIVAFAIATLSISACASTKHYREKEPGDPDLTAMLERERDIETMKANFRRIHFEFDSASITETTRDILSQNVEIMLRHPEIAVEIEGHCDEAGSEEYNLALGQRRADSIRKYVVAEGIPGSRLKTISFGEEMPLVSGGTDGGRALNRRAEFKVVVGRNVVGDSLTSGDDSAVTLAFQ